jgi:hypothetical protein
MRAIILSLGVIIAAMTAIPLATAQSADAPQIENARLEKKALAGALATEVNAWAAKAEQPSRAAAMARLRCAADGARARDVLRRL